MVFKPFMDALFMEPMFAASSAVCFLFQPCYGVTKLVGLQANAAAILGTSLLKKKFPIVANRI